MTEPTQEVQEVDAAQPRQMLSELAPLVDAVELREQEGAFLLCFEDELIVLIESDAYRDCLVLTAELGFPRVGSEAAVHKQLLQVAARWQDMLGVHMGLDPEDDCVLQIAEVAMTNLSLEVLTERVETFVATARHCRQVLAEQEDSSRGLQTFIRV
ncbi:type III secretion system chaperone [Ramlibacter rhizophilus]|uniref:Type III secretion system chaperone n=1 Tax=Ramlibacter rhizophilus TaxID=1781167 RepID=A0A4Z0BSG0_9BURK|nr:type III secretion system chaperone [Ramlibacter rhizophilus]TFZ01370.1 hypothetical protein EZ242_08300 [Ramlibacter rhizophilus]